MQIISSIFAKTMVFEKLNQCAKELTTLLISWNRKKISWHLGLMHFCGLIYVGLNLQQNVTCKIFKFHKLKKLSLFSKPIMDPIQRQGESFQGLWYYFSSSDNFHVSHRADSQRHAKNFDSSWWHQRKWLQRIGT